jgi:hypothetical protein
MNLQDKVKKLEEAFEVQIRINDQMLSRVASLLDIIEAMSYKLGVLESKHTDFTQ